MTDLATVTVSSNESETPPQANQNQTIAAAIETGKAVAEATQAAAEAKQAAAEAKVTPELEKLRAELREEIAQVAEIVGSLQQVVEQEAEELEEAKAETDSEADGTPAPALASVVEIDVPKEANRSQKTTPMTAPNQDSKSGKNVLRKMFLNL